MSERVLFWVVAWMMLTVVQSIVIVKAIDGGRHQESTSQHQPIKPSDPYRPSKSMQ